jgi:uncharacterized membrane protein YdcZ (DUF606 family)
MNNSTGVLDFSRVSAEIHSLVTRRRELLIFLGSLFAGMGLYLQNILEGKLPASLGLLEKHAFASFAVGLYVPSLLLALRLAKLHAGMIINGVFYAKIRREELSPGYAVGAVLFDRRLPLVAGCGADRAVAFGFADRGAWRILDQRRRSRLGARLLSFLGVPVRLVVRRYGDR